MKNADDDLIYRGVAKPISKRSIPMKHLLRPAAPEVFAEWKTKTDKIRY